jgi:ankyrin repeat protein
MNSKLTARDVLDRYIEECLPEFTGMKLLDVNQKGNSGNTPLSVAATRGDIDEVLALLDGGADPNISGEHGVTPLHDAVGQGHVEIAKLLIRMGARTDATAEFGGSPKDWAKRNGNHDLVAIFE